MSDKLISRAVFTDFPGLKESFDRRIDAIRLGDEEASREAGKTGQKLIRDKVAGLFKITDLANTIWKWNEETEKALKGLKRDKLLETYFRISEQTEKSVENLRRLLTSATGNVIFNKILAIVDEGPPDQEMPSHLASVMSTIAESEFEILFDQHRHALAQIGRLTPQALTILEDGASWPHFNLSSSSTVDGVVESEWTQEFSLAYATVKGISEDGKLANRLGHCVFELQNARLIVAVKAAKGGFHCAYTPIGNEIRQYIERT